MFRRGFVQGGFDSSYSDLRLSWTFRPRFHGINPPNSKYSGSENPPSADPPILQRDSQLKRDLHGQTTSRKSAAITHKTLMSTNLNIVISNRTPISLAFHPIRYLIVQGNRVLREKGNLQAIAAIKILLNAVPAAGLLLVAWTSQHLVNHCTDSSRYNETDTCAFSSDTASSLSCIA